MKVYANYYLQIFNNSAEPSLQRPWQKHIDEPVQVFYQFNAKVPATGNVNLYRLPPTEVLKSVGFPVDTGKLTIFPQAQNQILLRLANYADKFDAQGATPYTNIRTIATALYLTANPGAQAPKIDITETSLTGNQPYSVMQGNKIQWKGVDDAKINPPNLPQDKSQDEIALEPQRIRVFKILYTPVAQTAAFLSQ